MLRKLGPRAIEEARPDFGGGQGHFVPDGVENCGDRTYPTGVDKSTLVQANKQGADLTYL
jgi:hypothetical protein